MKSSSFCEILAHGKERRTQMVSMLTKREAKTLARATKWCQLVDVAVAALHRMPWPVVQVCGPMSTGGFGDHGKNMYFFREAIGVLSERRMNVFDQMPFQDAMIRLSDYHNRTDYCTDILTEFYQPLFEADGVAAYYFIPWWQTSHGSRWERKTLRGFGKTLYQYPWRLAAIVGIRTGLGFPESVLCVS